MGVDFVRAGPSVNSSTVVACKRADCVMFYPIEFVVKVQQLKPKMIPTQNRTE